MNVAFAASLALLLTTQVVAKELFAARCVPALTKGEFTWRVEESRRGVRVLYADPKKRYSAELRGRDAASLRASVARLRLSQADVEFLRSIEVRAPDGLLLLRPFDGVTYYLTIPPHEVIWIDNPSFDLEHHPELEGTVRLREVLDLIERLVRIAKKEKSG